jgi:hypothetical protein
MRGRRPGKTGGVFVGIHGGFFRAQSAADGRGSFVGVERSMSDRLLGLRWLFEAIDEIARSSGQIGGDLLGVAGGNIFLQSLQKSEDLHAGRHLAYPEVRTGLQFFHVSLHTKPWMLHEIRR